MDFPCAITPKVQKVHFEILNHDLFLSDLSNELSFIEEIEGNGKIFFPSTGLCYYSTLRHYFS